MFVCDVGRTADGGTETNRVFIAVTEIVWGGRPKTMFLFANGVKICMLELKWDFCHFMEC